MPTPNSKSRGLELFFSPANLFLLFLYNASGLLRGFLDGILRRHTLNDDFLDGGGKWPVRG